MNPTRLAKYAAALAATVVVCYFFPLLEVRPLGVPGAGAAPPTAVGPADPAGYVRDFWAGPLRRGEGAVEFARLRAAINADVTQARQDYGRQAGLGGPWHFCVRGEGTVESMEADRCILQIADDPGRVCINLGVVVDNTVRDAVGVDVNRFANSQDFNSVSAELNQRVEQEVIKAARPELRPGVAVAFVGCAKIAGVSDLDPLCLVPIYIRVTERGPSE